MYLSRLDMKLSDRSVRAALRDAQQMHRLVTGLFGVSREEGELLYRCVPRGSLVSVYLYSGVPVDRTKLLPWMTLGGEREMSEWLESMREGQLRGFDLETMPFKKMPAGYGGNSRRRVLRTREERLAWLERKASQNGFRLIRVEETQSDKGRAMHAKENGGELFLDAYRYTGILEITDASAFRNAVCRGIGAGKAYGHGMLLLKG